MKTLISALLILLLAGPLWAGQTVISLTGTGGTGATYLYSGTGEPYSTDSPIAATYPLAAPVVTVGAGTATEICFYMNDAGNASTCNIQLFISGGDTWALDGDTVASPANGWNCVTISKALAATTTYEVWVACNATTAKLGENASCSAFYKDSGIYTDPVTQTATDRHANGTHCIGARIKIE